MSNDLISALNAVGDPRKMDLSLPSRAADEIDRLRHALRIIAGEYQCAGDLLSHPDIARIALYGH